MNLVGRIFNFIEKQERAGLYPKRIQEQVHRGGKTFMRTRTVMVKPERHFIEAFHGEPHGYVDALANAVPWSYGVEDEQKITEGTKNLRPVYRMFKRNGENEAAAGVASVYWLLKKGKVKEAEQKLQGIRDYLKQKYPKPKDKPREGSIPPFGAKWS